MDISKYIIKEALILIPVLYIIGMMLKATPKIYDWVIPYVLLILGSIGGLFLVGFNANGVIQGILVAGSTVFANQLIKQIGKRD